MEILTDLEVDIEDVWWPIITKAYFVTKRSNNVYKAIEHSPLSRMWRGKQANRYDEVYMVAWTQKKVHDDKIMGEQRRIMRFCTQNLL